MRGGGCSKLYGGRDAEGLWPQISQIGRDGRRRWSRNRRQWARSRYRPGPNTVALCYRPSRPGTTDREARGAHRARVPGARRLSDPRARFPNRPLAGTPMPTKAAAWVSRPAPGCCNSPFTPPRLGRVGLAHPRRRPPPLSKLRRPAGGCWAAATRGRRALPAVVRGTESPPPRASQEPRRSRGLVSIFNDVRLDVRRRLSQLLNDHPRGAGPYDGVGEGNCPRSGSPNPLLPWNPIPGAQADVTRAWHRVCCGGDRQESLGIGSERAAFLGKDPSRPAYRPTAPHQTPHNGLRVRPRKSNSLSVKNEKLFSPVAPAVLTPPLLRSIPGKRRLPVQKFCH